MNDPIPIFGQSNGEERRRFRPVRLLVVLFATLFLIAVGGFLQFVLDVPEPAEQAATAPALDVDAVVVLTGGRDRIQTAMQLLESGTGSRLLISGVNTDITREDLAAQFGGPNTRFDCCVDLGFRARTTMGNADETRRWAAEKNYASIAVVTSDYHMPRSLLLLRSEMPDVTLIPVVVASSNADSGQLFGNVRVARLLVSEYAKYVITLLRTRFG
ncbi:MAG: YdcF family protein [Pseudomonadota bacterium]